MYYEEAHEDMSAYQPIEVTMYLHIVGPAESTKKVHKQELFGHWSRVPRTRN